VYFVLSSVIWGVPYLLVKIAVDGGVAPGFIAWSRVALGAAVLLPVALRRNALRNLRGRGGAIAAYTACEIAIPLVLIAVGLPVSPVSCSARRWCSWPRWGMPRRRSS